MASNCKQTKRRSWGRSTQREKVNIVENMELEVPDRLKPVTESASATKRTKIDLQLPELLATEKLLELLTSLRVPIPVYEGGQPSRDRLVFLYRKHVLPRPQRLRQKTRYKDAIYQNRECTKTAEPMDWDVDAEKKIVNDESEFWDGGGETSLLGKRLESMHLSCSSSLC